ncbi:MAG: hypothetical protein AAGC70_17380 [Pseudomonadota bacterium]
MTTGRNTETGLAETNLLEGSFSVIPKDALVGVQQTFEPGALIVSITADIAETFTARGT